MYNSTVGSVKVHGSRPRKLLQVTDRSLSTGHSLFFSHSPITSLAVCIRVSSSQSAHREIWRFFICSDGVNIH